MSEELQNYNFPLYPAEPLVKRAPRLDSEGIDLVSKFLLYEARKRSSAKDAMYHSYFASLGPGVYNLMDGKKNLSKYSVIHKEKYFGSFMYFARNEYLFIDA